MRKKELKLVVAFDTTADAMAMEKLCKEQGLTGRLIPVPREITAGCGLAWCAPLETRADLERAMESAHLRCQGFHQCMA